MYRITKDAISRANREHDRALRIASSCSRRAPSPSHSCVLAAARSPRLPFSRRIIRPITLCLNIYRAALGKHEPSLCMGAQHVGSPSLSRTLQPAPPSRYIAGVHTVHRGLPLSLFRRPLSPSPTTVTAAHRPYQHTDDPSIEYAAPHGRTHTARPSTANRKLNSRQRARRACSQLRGARGTKLNDRDVFRLLR